MMGSFRLLSNLLHGPLGCPQQVFAECDRVVVRRVAGGEQEGQRTVTGGLCERGQHLLLRVQLGEVPLLEALSTAGIVREPLPQRLTGGKLPPPAVEAGLLLAGAPRPEAVHQDAGSVPGGRGIVDAACSDLHARSLRDWSALGMCLRQGRRVFAGLAGRKRSAYLMGYCAGLPRKLSGSAPVANCSVGSATLARFRGLHRPLLLGLRTLAPQSAKVRNRPIADIPGLQGEVFGFRNKRLHGSACRRRHF